jgi:DNA-binding NtrC family response regulator
VSSTFCLKPFRSNKLLNAVARCLDRMRLQRENYVLRHELKSTSHQTLLRNKLLGDSTAIRLVRETIARVGPLPTSVLFTGESGTGKEIAARSLHAFSNRPDKLFAGQLRCDPCGYDRERTIRTPEGCVHRHR